MEKSAEAFRTISEVAEDLDLPQHVLRFWETRFLQIKPLKRAGGRRYYRPDDIELLRAIRQLLYSEGYTIKGVQKILKEQGVRFVSSAYRAAASAGGERMSLLIGTGPDNPSGGEDRFVSKPDPAAPQESACPVSPELVDSGQSLPNGAAAHVSAIDVRHLEALLREIAECERILHAARRF